MEGIEKKEAPQALVEYSEWWQRTYGRETSQEEKEQLMGFARTLKDDVRFQTILSECMIGNLYSVPHGGNHNDVTFQETVLVNALSTYGQEFGLRVD